jgi:hypothetical protein
MIKFGQWQPDQPKISAPHMIQALNVIPKTGGYGPLQELTMLSAPLGTRVRGAAAFRDGPGTVHVYAADATKLYALNTSATWDDLSRLSGGDYATADTNRTRFAQFGNLCLATNFADDIQSVDMTTANHFDALGGSPPRAKFLTTFRDFVVAGATDTSLAEIRWSAINNAAGWTKGVDQSDAQLLPDGGFVQGFAVSDTLTVFQQRKIRRMAYVGPPLIMQIDVLEEELGCLEPNSICQIGRKVFFLSESGWCGIIDGGTAQPIGEGEIDEFFAADVNQSYLYRMSAGINPVQNVAYWSYPSVSSPNGAPDTLLMFYFGQIANPNYTGPRWSIARYPTELIFNALALGYTLDGLDVLTTDLDSFTIPLDDPILMGGQAQFGGFTSDYTYGVFAGPALQATLETGDFRLNPAGRAYVSGVEPTVDAEDLTVSVAARERPMDAAVYTSAGSLEPHGMVSLEATGRYFRAKAVVGAGDDWTIAQGLDFEVAPEGEI